MRKFEDELDIEIDKSEFSKHALSIMNSRRMVMAGEISGDAPAHPDSHEPDLASLYDAGRNTGTHG